MQYDRDRSGTVEPHELQAALTSWGILQNYLFLQEFCRLQGEYNKCCYDILKRIKCC